MREPEKYREELYQWIWENLEFETASLKTVCGEPVSIIEPGILNLGAGPDFSQAQVRIGGRRWFGSVEIHKRAEEWAAHGHHEDPAYNRVILHVVMAGDHHQSALRQDGTVPPTLVLKPYLNQKLYALLRKMDGSSLACGGKTAIIHQKAFEIQIENAHAEYLEYKVEEILGGYDPSLPISDAWKSALILQIYRTLGIPSNRAPMASLAAGLLSKNREPEAVKSFVDLVREAAFHGKFNLQLDWNHSDSRPANRPQKRVRQAAFLHRQLSLSHLSDFYKLSPKASWNKLTGQIPGHELPGRQTLRILYNTAYIPALHLLGRLLHHKRLTEQATGAWQHESAMVPPAVSRPFKEAGFELGPVSGRMGLAHQFKRYCKEQQCHRCEVFKSAIHS